MVLKDKRKLVFNMKIIFGPEYYFYRQKNTDISNKQTIPTGSKYILLRYLLFCLRKVWLFFNLKDQGTVLLKHLCKNKVYAHV